MIPTSIQHRRDELVAQRQPFVHAIVVRSEPPTSARSGDQAIIHADGRMEGFVGGQCTETSVKVAAIQVLQEREPLLLRVLPDGAAEFPESTGASVVVNPCLSGGAVEIFLEPVLPAPVLHVLGESPIAHAVAGLGDEVGYRVLRDTAGADLAGADAVVIARHGGAEVDEIRAALDAGAAYVGLVASHVRGGAVLDEAGLDEDQRARVFSPAGHRIGAVTPSEVAVSVLAQVIEVLHAQGITGGTPAVPAPAAQPRPEPELLTIGRGPLPAPEVAVDPICGMSVLVEPGAIRLQDGDQVRYFCRTGCRDAYAEQHGLTVGP
ncbi:XdhC family protein [Nocardioides humi]|uniref:Xanthine dehydrogenase accessory factor n=1 Tax=Nocardioides humi TaxID=449461 RepID=A0ABN2AKU0_9ACTN|nr:XdhC family protein [Nocardioides humi]